jgi:hypothetical protein
VEAAEWFVVGETSAAAMQAAADSDLACRSIDVNLYFSVRRNRLGDSRQGKEGSPRVDCLSGNGVIA